MSVSACELIRKLRIHDEFINKFYYLGVFLTVTYSHHYGQRLFPHTSKTLVRILQRAINVHQLKLFFGKGNSCGSDNIVADVLYCIQSIPKLKKLSILYRDEGYKLHDGLYTTRIRIMSGHVPYLYGFRVLSDHISNATETFEADYNIHPRFHITSYYLSVEFRSVWRAKPGIKYPTTLRTFMPRSRKDLMRIGLGRRRMRASTRTRTKSMKRKLFLESVQYH